MPAEQMLEHVRDNVFPFLRKLHGGEKSIYSKYMKNASFSIPTASLLAEAVKIINDIQIIKKKILELENKIVEKLKEINI